MMEEANKKKLSLTIKMRSSDDKVIRNKDVESTSSKKPSTKSSITANKKKGSTAPAVKKKLFPKKEVASEVKLTNQKETAEDRPLQMGAR